MPWLTSTTSLTKCACSTCISQPPTGVELWSHLNSRLHLIDFVMLVFLRKVGSGLCCVKLRWGWL
jgi:hypothetical protein